MDTLIFALLIHFLADFALQTHNQATKKSSSNWYLFLHVGTYSLVWFLATFAYTNDDLFALSFASITFVAHFITDYITSRMSKQFFDNQDFHNGFVVIGFDQLLHYIQLFATLEYLNSL